MLKTLTVSLSDRSYPITIGEHTLTNFELFKLKLGQRVLIATNEIVAPLYLSSLTNMLEKNGVKTDHVRSSFALSIGDISVTACLVRIIKLRITASLKRKLSSNSSTAS